MPTYAQANEDGLYGLDKELAEKRAAKYDVGLENSVKEWIEAVLGEPLPGGGDLLDRLKDGVALCKVVERIRPGSVKYKASRMPFVQMENINAFLRAAGAFGVPAHESFMTVDLFEKKNPSQVVLCLVSLTRHALSAAGPSWPHAPVGSKLSAPAPRAAFPSGDKPAGVGTGWNTAQYGYTLGASQSSEGVRMGQGRDVTSGAKGAGNHHYYGT